MVCDIKSGQNPFMRGVSAPLNPKKMLGDMITSNSNNMFSLRPQGRYMHGARCKIKMNGRIAAFAFSISWTMRAEQDEIMTIDEYMPYEYAPKKMVVEGTIGSFRVPGKSPAGEQLHANKLSFLFHKYISIEVRDWQTDELLLWLPKAVIDSRTEDHRAGELSTMTLHFKAIGWQDELEPTMPSSPKEGKETETQGGGATSNKGPAIPLPNTF